MTLLILDLILEQSPLKTLASLTISDAEKHDYIYSSRPHA
jgi:hypothetical protein